jgi:type IV pilus assembly protein PilY1
MKQKIFQIAIRQSAFSLSAAALIFFTSVVGAVNLSPVPPHLTQVQGAPQTMLNMSRDHQLFYKAYNEYSDLDADGLPETQYKHSYKYYGYFDNMRCYVYSTSANQFNPVRKAGTGNYCGGTNEWSGNFLNWASMTRMDVVRRILYGGTRSTDSTNETVLERANLPTDAHSFAKYYAGSDIRQLTPFNEPEITLCNATYGSATGSNRYSHTNTNPPIIRVAKGNFSLWNANERWQCYWQEEKNASNGNNIAVSGINASSSNPNRDDFVSGGVTISSVALGSGIAKGSFVARVRVCDATLVGGLTDDERLRCRQYPSLNWKPVGLLHKYGEGNLAAFGLMTGSFDKNVSGGVLRKNVESFSNEVNSATNGAFTSAQGIVFNLNKLRVFGYDYNDGTYIGADNCSFQQIGLSDGTCTSWGNPMGEIFLESLRYMAGRSATSSFTAGVKDAAVGMTVASWSDPFRDSTIGEFGAKACRAINVVNFSASVNSYDGNSLGGFTDLNPQTGLSLTNLTDFIGQSEGIYAPGSQWFVGSSGAVTDNLCTGKSISSLANARGICPEAPSYSGSYSIAGLALHAHTRPIRTDIPFASTNTTAFKVDTYGVSLSTSTPSIKVPVGSTGRFVVIQPAYRLAVGAGGGGTLVDFRVVQQTPTYGKYVVQWEDSEQGGDYDQDVWGTLEYSVGTSNQLSVSTFVAAESTANAQGFGYTITGTNGKDGVHFHSGIRGFTFSDPRNVSVSPNTNINASGGCNNCQVGQPKTTAQYTMVGVPDGQLKDPLWYAAKYGKFDRTKIVDNTGTVANYVPGSTLPTAAWDAMRSDGSSGSDGVPDGYFLAVNPDELERSLAALFQQLFRSGGAAPAATSAQTLSEVGIFVTSYKFSPQTATADVESSGELSKLSFDQNGVVRSLPDWEASDLLMSNGANGRAIITRNAAGGTAFRWLNLSANAQALLNTNPLGVNDGAGANRVLWVRGDPSVEAAPGTVGLRSRGANKLGAIINSSPWYLGRSAAGYGANDFGGGYPTFRATTTNRSMVFVGSNGGMVHGFNASTGAETLAYVPTPAFSKLSLLTSKQYNQEPIVDGSVFAADIKVGGPVAGSWATYLFGTLGRGGQGVYALDVTNPANFSEANASSIAKWEFVDTDDPQGDLGQIIGRPTNRANGQPAQVVYMNNNRFAVIFGNGYNSQAPDTRVGSGRSALYILFVEGPTGSGGAWQQISDYVKIPTGALGAGPDNGLATPMPVDVNRDGKVDFIYAGDLKGNMWKFDVRNASAASWAVSFGGQPLYQARSTGNVIQPITTAPSVIPHPDGGYVVSFGTGKSLGSGDFPSTAQNTIYGVWDKSATLSAVGSPVTGGRASLLGRSFTTTGITRSLPRTEIDWGSQLGWYLDLPISGEVMIFNPLVLNIDQVVIRTLFPNTGSDCGASSSGFTMVLNPVTGSASPNSIDLNRDGKVDGDDVPQGTPTSNDVAGVRSDNEFDLVRLPPKLPTSGAQTCVSSVGSTTAAAGLSVSQIYGICRSGRIGWREVVGNKN